MAAKKRRVTRKKKGLTDEGAALAQIVTEPIDPWEGLTERQAHIQALKLRGMTQGAIAKLLGVSQPFVNQELKRIQKIHKENGTQIDKDLVIGMQLSKYEVLQQRAWEIYARAGAGAVPNTAVQLQCLQAIATFAEKRTKTMSDFGLLEKAAKKVEHSFKPSGPTIVDTWESEGRKQFAKTIITSQLPELAEPEPPADDEDEESGE